MSDSVEHVDDRYDTSRGSELLNKPIMRLKDFNDAIVEIAENSNPSVVTITTQRTREVRMMDPFSMFLEILIPEKIHANMCKEAWVQG